MRNLFNDNEEGVSVIRLNALRIVFMLNFLGLGKMAWSEIITHTGSWGSMQGVAFSFWAALATLMGLGLIYPLRMLPLLLIQFLYKVIWLLGIVLPQWRADVLDANTKGLITVFLLPVVIDLIVVPWGYVVKNYFLRPRKKSVSNTG